MNKKIICIVVLVIIIFIIVGGILWLNRNKNENKIEEYTPVEEITDEQYRQTIVSLYFNSKETNMLVPEARSVDVKEITKEPYLKLVDLLIQGTKSEKLENVIPEGTKVNSAKIKDNIVYVDLSKEFIENHKGGAEEESKTIYSIVNTLTQLNEVDGIKIIIDGEENKEFKDKYINFSNVFVRKD